MVRGSIPFLGMRYMVTRFAPSPSYYPHLGHLRGLLLLKRMVMKEYGGRGRIYLRFDDTGAQDYRPQYMRAFIRLFHEYQVPLAGVFKASARIHVYLKSLKALMSSGKAYICSCPNTTQRKYRLDCSCDRHSTWRED